MYFVYFFPLEKEFPLAFFSVSNSEFKCTLQDVLQKYIYLNAKQMLEICLSLLMFQIHTILQKFHFVKWNSFFFQYHKYIVVYRTEILRSKVVGADNLQYTILFTLLNSMFFFLWFSIAMGSYLFQEDKLTFSSIYLYDFIQ